VSEQHDEHVHEWRRGQYDEHAREPSQVLASPRRRVTVLRRHRPEELGSELNLFAMSKAIDAGIAAGIAHDVWRDRGRTDRATAQKLKSSHQQDDLLVEVAIEILNDHPERTRRQVARDGRVRFNKALGAQGLRTLKWPTIYKYLGPLWPCIITRREG
jgi:hypothetical protein